MNNEAHSSSGRSYFLSALIFSLSWNWPNLTFAKNWPLKVASFASWVYAPELSNLGRGNSECVRTYHFTFFSPPEVGDYCLLVVIEWIDKREVLEFWAIRINCYFLIAFEGESTFRKELSDFFNSMDSRRSNSFWSIFKNYPFFFKDGKGASLKLAKTL